MQRILLIFVMVFTAKTAKLYFFFAKEGSSTESFSAKMTKLKL